MKVFNFLSLRPLSNGELMASLTAVLTGLTRSWWMAKKARVKNWKDFRAAFLNTFLPTDYMTEVQEKVMSLVQAPDRCLRDFVYDYKALCLKWKPDVAETEMVRKIMNNCNPSFISSSGSSWPDQVKRWSQVRTGPLCWLMGNYTLPWGW